MASMQKKAADEREKQAKEKVEFAFGRKQEEEAMDPDKVCCGSRAPCTNH